MESSLDEFVHSLHQEKLNAMLERSKYARDKIVFILGILGFGALNFGTSEFNSTTILYVVPLVAIGYDLYINASDEAIKRIGAFLRTTTYSSKCEHEYEEYTTEKRGKSAPMANVLFSLIGTFGALAIILLSQNSVPYYLFGWFLLWGVIIGAVYVKHRRLIEVYDSNPLPPEGEIPG